MRPRCGTVDLLFTLARILKGHGSLLIQSTCYVDLKKAYGHVTGGILWGVLREYGVVTPQTVTENSPVTLFPLYMHIHENIKT